MYEVPNDWQELDEEETSDNGQELLSAYGPFSVILYARIKKLKLFNINDIGDFLENLADFYVRNIKETEKSEAAVRSLQTLVGLFPPPGRFMQLLRFHQQKGREMIFFKLALDILHFYYKATEAPMFVRLQRDVIPLGTRLYRNLSEETLKEIADILRSCVGKSKQREDRVEDQVWFVLFKEKNDYQRYYQEETIEYENLTAGNSMQMYYV